MWRAIRGSSQIEGPQPTEAGTISGTNVGPELGNAQILEAAARRGRGMECRTAARADFQRGDVLRGIAAMQKTLRAGDPSPDGFRRGHPCAGGRIRRRVLSGGTRCGIGCED